MGGFHCPVGAIGYEAAGCIRCHMCTAVTEEEVNAATNIVRTHIRGISEARRRKRVIRKIAVCGKGGAGKSTFTALLARAMEAYGYRVLVIDTDDSNAGLMQKLGIQKQPDPLIYYLPRFSKGVETGDTRWLQKDDLTIDEIPAKNRSVSGGVELMTVGKIENPFQGCSCTMGDLTRELVLNLAPQKNEVMIADQDAGVESFGRGVEQGVDTVLILVEPSYESVELAERIQYMAEGLGIRRIRAILNKVASDEQEELMLDMLAERKVRWLGVFRSDESLAMANLRGRPLSETALFQKVWNVARLMMDEAEMKYILPIASSVGLISE